MNEAIVSLFCADLNKQILKKRKKITNSLTNKKKRLHFQWMPLWHIDQNVFISKSLNPSMVLIEHLWCEWTVIRTVFNENAITLHLLAAEHGLLGALQSLFVFYRLFVCLSLCCLQTVCQQ